MYRREQPPPHCSDPPQQAKTFRPVETKSEVVRNSRETPARSASLHNISYANLTGEYNGLDTKSKLGVKYVHDQPSTDSPRVRHPRINAWRCWLVCAGAPALNARAAEASVSSASSIGLGIGFVRAALNRSTARPDRSSNARRRPATASPLSSERYSRTLTIRSRSGSRSPI